MKKLIVSGLLLASAASFSVESGKVNTCFNKVSEEFYASNGGEESFQQYVEDLRACQEAGDNYLGRDFNDCVKEANRAHAQERKDCSQNRNANERRECNREARKTHSDSRAACERVQHSDNATKAIKK